MNHTGSSLIYALVHPRRALSVMGLVLLSCAGAPLAHGENYVSVSSGTWNTATIWNPNGTPGVSDSVTIQANNRVTNTTSMSVGSLTINSGGAFAVGAATTLGALLNNGTLTVGNNSSARALSFTGSFTNNGLINTASTGPYHTINFRAGTPCLWVGSGDISLPKASVIVDAGAVLDISGLSSPLKFKSAGTVGVTLNGTLITGTQTISGNGNATCSFTQGAGALLVTANPNGIINGTTGLLNLSGPFNFNPGANYMFNGTVPQITAGLPAVVNDLTITNAAGVTLSAATTVGATLALENGLLTTTSSATPTVALVTVGGGSYVNGPLAMVFYFPSSQTFPVGKGGHARAVTLNYTSLTGISTVTVEQFESAMGGTLPPSTSQFNSRYWSIRQSGGSDLVFDLVLDGTGYTPANSAVILQQGTPHASYPAAVSAPYYTATGILSVGDFTLGNYNPSADQLAFTTTAQTLTAGVLSSTITVQLRDSGGNPRSYATNLTVNLSSTSAAGSFRDAADTMTISSLTIPAGNSSASFRYSDTAAPGQPTLVASATAAITPATQQQTVNPAAASKLAFTAQPVSGHITYLMSNVVVQVEDQYGNPVAQSSTAISLTLNNGGSSLLTGSIPRQTDGTGSATFDDLVITGAPRLGLTLTAAGGGFQVVSREFNMTSRIIVKARNNTSMDQPSSWTEGVVPGIPDTVQFDNTTVGSSASTITADIGSDASWYGINVFGWNSTSSWTVSDGSGTRIVTLGPAGLVGSSLTRSITFNNGFALATGQTWLWGDTNSTGGTLILNGSINNGGHPLTIGGTRPVEINADLSGAGSLRKTGTGTLTLNASVSYTGDTLLSSGTLNVNTNGVLAQSGVLSIASDARVAGNGTINSQTINNGTLAPGYNANTLGTLTFANGVTLNSGSTNFFKVNKTLSPSNDSIVTPASITAGGALVVTNLGTAPQLGDSFQLFSHPISGSFSSLRLPDLPAGYAWTNRLGSDGSIAVIERPVNTDPPTITATVINSQLVLEWPADHIGWHLEAQTNSVAGLATGWVEVIGSREVNSLTNGMNALDGSVFYRLAYP